MANSKWRMANGEWRMANEFLSPARYPPIAIPSIGPLCPPSRRRGKRIVGPGMLRVAAAHTPRARRRSCPRQKPGRSRVVCTGRCAGEKSSISSGTLPPAIAGWRSRPNNFLDADRYLRPAVRIVVDRNPRAGRSREMGGRLGVKAALQGIGQARRECGFSSSARSSASAVLPSKSAASQSASAASAASNKSGHSAPSARRRKATRSHPCRRAWVHGSRSTPSRATFGQDARGGRVRRRRHRLLGQHKRAEPALAARAQGRGRLIEGDLLARVNAVGETRLDLGQRDRRGEQDAARRCAAGKFGHGYKWRAANGDAGSTCAPRPLAKRNAPAAPPRFLAIRSGRRGRGRRRRKAPPLPPAFPLPLVGRG